MSRLLDREVYHLVENVVLPAGDDTTQIDHLVISRYGVFVIETKNMTGWIFGQASQAHWTQVIYRHRQRFQNPIMQNEWHVMVVRRVLDLKPHQVHNVVALVGDSVLKTPMPDEVVEGVYDLADYIESKSVPVFSEDEVLCIIEDLSERQLDPEIHGDLAQARSARRRAYESTGGQGDACPRCGGTMVVRTNRRTGERFLGCRRYPQCRGVRSLR